MRQQEGGKNKNCKLDKKKVKLLRLKHQFYTKNR